MNKPDMKILYYISKKGVPIGTGSGTNTDIVLDEMSKRHKIGVYRNIKDLNKGWDLIHALDFKHLDRNILKHKKCPLLTNIRDYYFTKYYSFHCPDFPLRFFMQKYRKQKYNRMIKKVDGVIVHSNFMKYSIDHTNKYLVRHSINKKYHNTKDSNNRNNDILFVGRDYFRKGLYTLLKALKIILLDHPNTRLIVVGREPFHSALYAKIISLGLPVIYYNRGLYGKELANLYKTCGVFSVPSEIEAFGIVFLEAMAADMPIITTKVGGIPEIIEHKKTGYLVDRGDYKKLAYYIKYCINKKYPEMENYRREKLKYFSTDLMIHDLENAYKDLIKI